MVTIMGQGVFVGSFDRGEIMSAENFRNELVVDQSWYVSMTQGRVCY
jgi:hypothetical protein